MSPVPYFPELSNQQYNAIWHDRKHKIMQYCKDVVFYISNGFFTHGLTMPACLSGIFPLIPRIYHGDRANPGLVGIHLQVVGIIDTASSRMVRETRIPAYLFSGQDPINPDRRRVSPIRELANALRIVAGHFLLLNALFGFNFKRH